MPTERVNLPAWVLVLLGILVFGIFVGVRMFGPDYVAIPYGGDPADCDRLKEVLRTRGIPFIATESDLWIPRRELSRLRADPPSSIEIVYAR